MEQGLPISSNHGLSTPFPESPGQGAEAHGSQNVQQRRVPECSSTQCKYKEAVANLPELAETPLFSQAEPREQLHM